MMTLVHSCPWCGETLDMPGMPAKQTKIEIVCPECTKTTIWGSGIRTDRFRWFPLFRCLISWCKDEGHYMTPLCRAHWSLVPVKEAQVYWRSTADALPSRISMDVARVFADRIEIVHRPNKIEIEFE